MKSILKTADPTIVPTPTSLFAINTPVIQGKKSLSRFFTLSENLYPPKHKKQLTKLVQKLICQCNNSSEFNYI